MFFLHKRFSRFGTLLFQIEFLISIFGYDLGLCALFIACVNPREFSVSLSLEIERTFLILRCFQEKCLSCGVTSKSNVAFLISLKLFQVFAGYALCCMFLSLCLARPEE